MLAVLILVVNVKKMLHGLEMQCSVRRAVYGSMLIAKT